MPRWTATENTTEMEGLQYLAPGMFAGKEHQFQNDRLIEKFGLEGTFEKSSSPTLLKWTGLPCTRAVALRPVQPDVWF